MTFTQQIKSIINIGDYCGKIVKKSSAELKKGGPTTWFYGFLIVGVASIFLVLCLGVVIHIVSFLFDQEGIIGVILKWLITVIFLIFFLKVVWSTWKGCKKRDISSTI